MSIWAGKRGHKLFHCCIIIIQSMLFTDCYALGGSGTEICNSPNLKKEKCLCVEEENIRKEVHCVGLKSANIVQVLAEVDASVVELTVTNGTLINLNKLLDCTKMYDKLTTLTLTRNQIRYLHPSAFDCMPNLASLNLNYNQIYVDGNNNDTTDYTAGDFLSKVKQLRKLEMVHTFAEKNLLNANLSHVTHLPAVLNTSNVQFDKLVELDISNNTGLMFDNNAPSTCRMPKLRKLHMNRTRHASFPFQHMCVTELEELHIADNWIMYVTDIDIEYLKKIPNILMARNPYECTCAVRNFYDFLKNDQVKDRHMIECNHPFDLRGQKLIELSRGDLQCSSAVTDTIMQPIYAIMAVLFLAIFAVVLLCIVMNKKTLKRLPCFGTSKNDEDHVRVAYSAVDYA